MAKLYIDTDQLYALIDERVASLVAQEERHKEKGSLHHELMCWKAHREIADMKFWISIKCQKLTHEEIAS